MYINIHAAKEREFTGEVEVKNVNGKSTLANIYNRYPLKFLTPKISANVTWVYMVNFGGGLVSLFTMERRKENEKKRVIKEETIDE